MILLAIVRLLLMAILLIVGIFAPEFMLSDLAHLLLAIMGIHGSCTEDDRARMVEFYHTHDKGVMMFSHPTFYDYIVIVHELKRRFLFIALAQYIFFPINHLYKRYFMHTIKMKSGASQEIKKLIEARKAGERLLAIAPSGGSCTTDQAKMAPFRSGGFIARAPVLPVVIRYDPYEPWLDNVATHQIVWQRLTNPKPIRYQLRVLDPVYPIDGEPLQEFMDRVKTAMEKNLAMP